MCHVGETTLLPNRLQGPLLVFVIQYSLAFFSPVRCKGCTKEHGKKTGPEQCFYFNSIFLDTRVPISAFCPLKESFKGIAGDNKSLKIGEAHILIPEHSGKKPVRIATDRRKLGISVKLDPAVIGLNATSSEKHGHNFENILIFSLFQQNESSNALEVEKSQNGFSRRQFSSQLAVEVLRLSALTIR